MANFQNEREQLAQLEELFQQKKFVAGLTQAEAVIQQFPVSFQLRFLKYKFLRALDKTGEAVQLLREMHGMFGDNIMVLKELADLNFQLHKHPESLLYYKKLLFLDSFNTVAQERVRQLQESLSDGVAANLADTKVEMRLENAAAPARPGPSALESPPPPEITFDSESEPTVLPGAKAAAPPAGDLSFETESAAELYFKQGLYTEALAIYKNLFEKTGRTDFFLKIKAILLLLRTDRSNQIIERLQKFLLLIQQRGSQIV